jgi:hypothetical protein
MRCRDGHTQKHKHEQAVCTYLKVEIRNAMKKYGGNACKDAGIQKKRIRVFSTLKGMI